jgi:MFS family permease
MMNILSQALKAIEGPIIQSTNWPLWAVRTILVLFGILGGMGIAQMKGEKEGAVAKAPADSGARRSRRLSKAKDEGNVDGDDSFFWFQLQYLSVYLIVMLADWLQGPNMYTLYTSYGVDVGTLFITGFLSSAIFGTFVGVYVDLWGRKLGCVVFCVLEIIINLLEHVPNFTTLMVGRILGGISTSLLFSAFESWMVSEHRKRGYKEEWLAKTFALASSGNGVVAIVAGFIAQISADLVGDIGPFQVAIALTVVALVLVMGWEENYGESPQKQQKSQKKKQKPRSRSASRGRKNNKNDKNDAKEVAAAAVDINKGGMLSSMKTSLALCFGDAPIFCLGMSQAIFEGAVYTFVFMWVKAFGMLLGDGSSVHTGLVMTCFMLAMTIGGSASSWLLPSVPGGAHVVSVGIYLVAAAAMAVPVFSFSFFPAFVSFLVLEAMVGMFNASGATLRSQYYPEAQQSTIMTVFRIPLNALVVLGTHLSDGANDQKSLQTVFMIVAGMHVLAALLQLGLNASTKQQQQGDKKRN